MQRIDVLVSATSADVKAEAIAESVAARHDMSLVARRCLDAAEVDALLASLPCSSGCAVVLVGRHRETSGFEQRWLAARADLVLLHVDVADEVVRISVRDPRLDALLTSLRELVEGMSTRHQRVARVALHPAAPNGAAGALAPPTLLDASVAWLHQTFRDAVEAVPEGNGDVHGFSVTCATLLQALDAPVERVPGAQPGSLAEADAALDRALAIADGAVEPLATLVRALELDPLELRLVVLGLAPELDPRFQRCIGFLLDELSRRVGTLGLYCALLGGPTRIRSALAARGVLGRWLLLDEPADRPLAADEPLRLDPFLARWLLGDRPALAQDPRLRRALRLAPWPGAALLERSEARTAALVLLGRLWESRTPDWLVLGGADPATWRALVELGARDLEASPLRVEPARLAGLDLLHVEQCGRLVARMARLTGEPLVVDLTAPGDAERDDRSTRAFLDALADAGCRAAVIGAEEAYALRLLGSHSYELQRPSPLLAEARIEAVCAAAAGAAVSLAPDAARAIAVRYPLQVDGLERAMLLARNLPPAAPDEAARLERFTAACKQVAAEGASQLAERIEPVFELDQVVLPSDRKQQLIEIVDHVRLAPRVLDDWKFRDQLPYGRGVTALFFGPSGTGKTMAAIGIARRLGIQLLRLDLSRVVSKYIGDTEKNIDRVFMDAQRSGAVILVDEADALLGKRSEVKDAHDRYANIEVAYLLQRMEAHEGLAILTTNLRQNLDPAFLRRLRFMVEFPRPDVEARERIWRQCLPAEAHALDDAAFRQLAKRIDLNGGNIRQITLRAAFIAAAADAKVALEHVAQAARAELAKLGMPPVELDLTRARRAA